MDAYSASDNGGMPLMNQQQAPPMFGDYSGDDYNNYYQDGDMGGGMDDGGDGGGDPNDAKRRRIARACDMCRKKKIKCDGKMPACSHCINYKTECIFTQVEKKRNPPKGAKYIEGLENRLGRMESLLKLSGLLGDDDDKTDLGTLEKRLAEQAKQAKEANATAERTPPRSDTASQQDGDGTAGTPAEQRQSKGRSTSPKSVPKKEEEVEALSDMMCSLVTNNCGEARYIGSSSGFSIFSPKGIQWVNEKTGDDSFQSMMSESASEDANKWVYWKPEIFGDIFTRRIFRPLPPLSETLSLLKDYFENFNCIFPLFHEPTFMHLVRRQYSRDPYTGSGWWASLNCALAIAHRLRVMSNLVPQEEDQKAWGHLKNALGVMAELTMRNTDLLSVQALLGMALFLQGTPNPQPSFLLVASAIRLAHSIGLHKKGSGFNLSPVEVEQRKRVFWIAYILDKDMCLRSGRPPAQDDDDMNVELPSEDPSDNIGNIPLSDGKGKTNLFRLMCTFSIIESKVYSCLYSTKATKQSDGELLNTIGDLDRELEDWKEDIPLEFRPEQEIKIAHTPLVLHVVVLHFAYYNCLTTIHRMSVHHGYWTSRLSNYAIQGLNARPLNPRVFSSAALCVHAARASIQLIRYIPQGDYACVWMIIYYPVTALVTLFANVLQNPQDARARADIRLMHQVVSFLSVLAVDEETGGVKRMLDVCVEFERIAKIVVDKSDKESHSRRKRKPRDEDDHVPRPAPGRIEPQSTTPKQPTPAPSTGLTPGFTGDHLTPQNNVSPQLATVNGLPSNGLPSSGLNPPNSASTNSTFSPSNSNVAEPGMLPELVPPPGVFPNPFTEPSDLTGAFGLNMGSPLNMGGFQQPFMQPDMWNQVPMNFDWDWANMQAADGQYNHGDQGHGVNGARHRGQQGQANGMQ